MNIQYTTLKRKIITSKSTEINYKKISLERLIYLTENIDLDITDETEGIEITEIPIGLLDIVDLFLENRIAQIRATKKVNYLLDELKESICI